ncbi:hypothetical protein NFI96_004733 [Prochilodus magdalenae]|nr:hypothetical protein NFI96_004733 [Prochilodus magdalenae]
MPWGHPVLSVREGELCSPSLTRCGLQAAVMRSFRMAPPLPLLFLLMAVGASGTEWSVKYNQHEICALEGSTVFMNGSYTHPEGLTVTETFLVIKPDEGKDPTDLRQDPGYSGRVETLTDEQKHFSLRLSDVTKKDEHEYGFRIITDVEKQRWLGKPGVQLRVTATHSSNTIIMFADDTTIISNITQDDEGLYREEVKLLTEWCAANNLFLNASKTKELITDFRKGERTDTPLTIGGTFVERVSSFKFLGVHLAEDVTWTLNMSHLVRKSQQRLQFLRRLRRVNLPQQLLCNFYRSTVESILTSCTTVWYSSTTFAERKALQRVEKNAKHVTATTLPPIQDIYDKRRLRKAVNISSDPCSNF